MHLEVLCSCTFLRVVSGGSSSFVGGFSRNREISILALRKSPVWSAEPISCSSKCFGAFFVPFRIVPTQIQVGNARFEGSVGVSRNSVSTSCKYYCRVCSFGCFEQCFGAIAILHFSAKKPILIP